MTTLNTDTLSTFPGGPSTIDFDGRPENSDRERDRAARYVAGAAHDAADALELLSALGLVEVPMARLTARQRRAAAA